MIFVLKNCPEHSSSPIFTFVSGLSVCGGCGLSHFHHDLEGCPPISPARGSAFVAAVPCHAVGFRFVALGCRMCRETRAEAAAPPSTATRRQGGLVSASLFSPSS